MWWLLCGAVALAQVPEGVDLEDMDRWDAGAEVFLDGPPGCWELVGKASWHWDFGRLGKSRGDAAFIGRLRDGVWEGFHIEPLGEVTRRGREAESRQYSDEPRFAPMFGQLPGGSISIEAGDRNSIRGERNRDATPGNLLRTALDELSTEVEIGYAQWDRSRNGVVYHRSLPLNRGHRAPDTSVVTFFPEGSALPTEYVVTFPERFHRGRLPRFKITDARAELRAEPSGGRLFPVAEAVRFDIGVLGFSWSGAQTIQYLRATPCGGAAVAEPDPEPAPAAATRDPQVISFDAPSGPVIVVEP